MRELPFYTYTSKGIHEAKIFLMKSDGYDKVVSQKLKPIEIVKLANEQRNRMLRGETRDGYFSVQNRHFN